MNRESKVLLKASMGHGRIGGLNSSEKLEKSVEKSIFPIWPKMAVTNRKNIENGLKLLFINIFASKSVQKFGKNVLQRPTSSAWPQRLWIKISYVRSWWFLARSTRLVETDIKNTKNDAKTLFMHENSKKSVENDPDYIL